MVEVFQIKVRQELGKCPEQGMNFGQEAALFLSSETFGIVLVPG